MRRLRQLLASCAAARLKALQTLPCTSQDVLHIPQLILRPYSGTHCLDDAKSSKQQSRSSAFATCTIFSAAACKGHQACAAHVSCNSMRLQQVLYMHRAALAGDIAQVYMAAASQKRNCDATHGCTCAVLNRLQRYQARKACWQLQNDSHLTELVASVMQGMQNPG